MPTKDSRGDAGLDVSGGSLHSGRDIIGGDMNVYVTPSEPKPRPSRRGVLIVLFILVILIVVLVRVLDPLQLFSPNKELTSTRTEIVGHVITLDTSLDVVSAKVSLDYPSAPIVTYTDQNGVFSYSIVTPSERQTVHLRVEKSGYEPYDQYVTIPPVNARPFDVRIVPTNGAVVTRDTVSTTAPVTGSPTSTETPTPTQTATYTPTRVPIQFIAYDSKKSGAREIFAMDPDGGNQRQITTFGSNSGNPACSPDGRYIAFNSEYMHIKFTLFVMGTHGETPHALDQRGFAEIYPSWSPDSTRIAIAVWTSSVNDPEIQVIALDGSATPFSKGTFPAWSPDGDRIAYETGEIMIVNTAGDVLRSVSRSVGWSGQPSWSPDGSQIAFASPGDSTQIFAMNADGTNVRQLTDSRGFNFMPRWSPDGKRIVFASNRAGNWDIYSMNADGSKVTQLTHDPSDETSPYWCSIP